MKKILYLTLALLSYTQLSNAQLLTGKKKFNRADSLRGTLSALRSCYDINYYHLDVKVDIDQKFISGSNEFQFKATQDFSKLQFDLFENLRVEKVVYKNKNVPFKREFNAVFVDFQQTITKGSKESFTVFYSGNPIIAKTPPWDGGFIFSKDKSGESMGICGLSGSGCQQLVAEQRPSK
jgi:hypothetical protein